VAPHVSKLVFLLSCVCACTFRCFLCPESQCSCSLLCVNFSFLVLGYIAVANFITTFVDMFVVAVLVVAIFVIFKVIFCFCPPCDVCVASHHNDLCRRLCSYSLLTKLFFRLVIPFTVLFILLVVSFIPLGVLVIYINVAPCYFDVNQNTHCLVSTGYCPIYFQARPSPCVDGGPF
jgi:hypothetical protein